VHNLFRARGDTTDVHGLLQRLLEDRTAALTLSSMTTIATMSTIMAVVTTEV
jgi:hypothetical protein